MSDDPNQQSNGIDAPDSDPPDLASMRSTGRRGERASNCSSARNEFHYDPALLLDPDTDRDAHDREWRRVFQEFDPRLRDYFGGRTEDGDQLDELVRHIWRKALLGLGMLASTRATWSWLVRVGENRLKDLGRGTTVERRRQKRLGHDAVVDEDLHSRLPNALERMASHDPFDQDRWPVDRDTFMRRWNDLPEADQRMIWLHDVEEWTHKEIAKVLGINKPGTARQRYSRAVNRLREG